MISKILNTLEAGISVMRSNSKILLIGILVFIFPLLFFWLTHNFFSTASTNIETIQKQKVAVIHDSLSTVLTKSNLISDDTALDLLFKIKSDNTDVSKIRVVEEIEKDFVVILDADINVLGTAEKSNQLYRQLPKSASENPFIYKMTINGKKVWQVLSVLETENRVLYIFTEHDFSFVDEVMFSRKQQSYFGLTAIFLFLIALAFWLNKQTNWEVKYNTLSLQLEERDLFSNMIAHEFRSPLTAIKGYASFLQESKDLKQEEMRYVDTIRDSTERLVILVNDFLEVARLQSGKMKLVNKQIDIREIVIAVTENLRQSAKEKGLELVYKPNANKMFITTDASRLTQVLINIVNNAIKYTKEGSVKLSCEERKGTIEIRIMDTGMGISAEDQKKLFTPFERVGGVESTETTGTGLGMYITKKLIELLGGNIEVESIKEVGSHIVITLDAD